MTGTLVTLKRLASVQEQRHTGAHGLPEKAASADGAYSDGEAHTASRSVEGEASPAAGRSENALDALLDELQTFSKDKRRPAESPVRVVEASKKTPPPPPPRTTSKSPVTSPTGPQRSRSEPVRTSALACEEGRRDQLSSNSSSSESVNSQEGLQGRSRQELLDSRHQELLRKQRQLQEQYARLQLLQRLSPPKPDLKKTGSESNILHKASLAMASASGSLTHLAIPPSASPGAAAALLRSGAKIYETDIL